MRTIARSIVFGMYVRAEKSRPKEYATVYVFVLRMED